MHDSQHDNFLTPNAEVDGVRKAMQANPLDFAVNTLEGFGITKQDAERPVGFMAEFSPQTRTLPIVPAPHFE